MNAVDTSNILPLFCECKSKLFFSRFDTIREFDSRFESFMIFEQSLNCHNWQSDSSPDIPEANTSASIHYLLQIQQKGKQIKKTSFPCRIKQTQIQNNPFQDIKLN